MLLYGVGVKPLFVVVKENDAEVFSDKSEKLFQVLFADDSSAAGKLETVLAWVRALVEEGPKYGYYPEPPKSVSVVKEGKEERAREVFAEYPDLEMSMVPPVRKSHLTCPLSSGATGCTSSTGGIFGGCLRGAMDVGSASPLIMPSAA